MEKGYYAERAAKHLAFTAGFLLLTYVLGVGGPCGGLGLLFALPALWFSLSASISAFKWLRR